ncbi:HD family phosphohydrolase [Clostridium oryzae]|uniref:HD domain protein n=1 Tax=Clostridium oryzae TaxID=1450648 RepID=A0A1V4IQC4_9CLOT|nr:HD family phosphohydrolase [Clostridium oryzae]OPJ62231.1 hypothetical protein CLORY_18390 [Clostridium oryzae]
MKFLIKSNTLASDLNNEFYSCIEDLLEDDLVQQMRLFKQHCNTNCLDHCIYVAYFSYVICKTFGFDFSSAARGGLLHDLFLYDWRTTKLNRGKHAFRHPQIALDNAKTILDLNLIEQDIIKKHMWPLTIIPPRYKEAFIICMVDKYCAILEILDYYINK